MRPLSWLSAFRGYRREERGSSAVEFAVWLTCLIYPTLNVADLGFYIFKTMQVREAAQAGVQTVEAICGYTGEVPAATNCSSLTTALITTAVASTSLGGGSTGVTLSGTPSEGWYCNNTSSALVLAHGTSTWNLVGGTATTQPSDCSSTVTSDTDAPGDYASVTVTYSYSPVLGSASILSLLTTSTSFTQTAWMRLN
jgi:hypothetical protein